jgi:bacterioferritin
VVDVLHCGAPPTDLDGRVGVCRYVSLFPHRLTFQTAFAETAVMQGNPKVIAALNEALKEELTAISQYFLHAEMCENWHYEKLGDYIKKQSIDEMKHAEALIERILFLDATPNMTELMKLTVGQNVKEQIESDLKLEINAVAMYNRAIRIATDEGDNTSRELFERLLKDEEDHVDWLEAQVHQIRELTYERYLSQQIREEK